MPLDEAITELLQRRKRLVLRGRRSGQLLEEPPGRAGGAPVEEPADGPPVGPVCVRVDDAGREELVVVERGVAVGALQRRVPRGGQSPCGASFPPRPPSVFGGVSRGSCSPGDRTPPNAPWAGVPLGLLGAFWMLNSLDVAQVFMFMDILFRGVLMSFPPLGRTGHGP